MVRLLYAVAAIAMVAPSIATAQYNHHDNNRHDNNRHETNRDNDRHDNNRHDNNRHKNDRMRHGSYGTYRIGHRPTTFRRMSVSSYRYPSGYSYRRWSVGSILPRLFLSGSYDFNDYGALGLGAAPPGYVWVRYGPDLLLVNRHNGRIVDVIHAAFY
jgi:Ni/Co efflux regulator RcnB